MIHCIYHSGNSFNLLAPGSNFSHLQGSQVILWAQVIRHGGLIFCLGDQNWYSRLVLGWSVGGRVWGLVAWIGQGRLGSVPGLNTSR